MPITPGMRCFFATVSGQSAVNHSVLLFSPMLQDWFVSRCRDLPVISGLAAIFAIVTFLLWWSALPQMAVPEVKNRQPAMMTLNLVGDFSGVCVQCFCLFVARTTGLFFWSCAPLSNHAAWSLDARCAVSGSIGRVERVGQADA